MEKYLDLICLGFCTLHFIITFLQSIFSLKSVKKICDKCLRPVVSDDSHVCGLSSDQLDLLVRFVSSMRGDNNAS